MSNKFDGIIPRELIQAIQDGKCVLFVGSGLSSKVKRSNNETLPSWGGFLKELLIYGIERNATFWNDSNHIKEMIEKGNYLMAAQELQECIGTGEFSDFLTKVFRDTSVKPTTTHNLICRINFRCILTSNYDTLIEGGYAVTNSGRIPQKFTQEDLRSISTPLRKDNFFIFKIHGDIDRPETIVLGSRSYTNLLFRTPEYLSFLETLFATHTVLFVGFGGSDPDLDYTLDRLSTIFSRTLDKHFILLPSTKFNLTEKRRLLLDRRLEVIEYTQDDNHTQVDSFLEELYSLTNKGSEEDESFQLITSKSVLLICSQKDGEIQKQIVRYIRSSGHIYNGWLFSEAFEEDLIQKHFKGTQVGLIVITKNSIVSESFQREIEYVILKETEDKIKLVVVVIGDVEIPRVLMNKLFIKLTKLDKNGFQRVLTAINNA